MMMNVVFLKQHLILKTLMKRKLKLIILFSMTQNYLMTYFFEIQHCEVTTFRITIIYKLNNFLKYNSCH